MKFRPCIDIHSGKVKQIVGSSLSIDGKTADENFVSENTAAEFAAMYKKDGLTGGHVIKLSGSEADDDAMISALKAYPGGLQAGGGMNDKNCLKYLEAGASHIIVTSWVFGEKGPWIERLESLVRICGRERIVIDLSCRKNDSGEYCVAVNRWQTMTDYVLNAEAMEKLSSYCGEFLIHGIGNEGMKKGPDCELVRILKDSPVPATYAGGIADMRDVAKIEKYGEGKVDFTVGSALDIFGGKMKYKKLKEFR